MREEFGFVSCYVYAYRAIAFAAFAGEAEIKRRFHFFALPSILNRVV